MISAFPMRMSRLMISGDKMLNRLIAFVSSLFFLLLVSCNDVADDYLTLDGQAQGTTFHIVYQDESDRDFSMAVDSLFRLMDSSMSLWDKNSLISRLNQNEPDLLLDEHFIAVFNQARGIAQATQGALDITIGPLVKAWKISSREDIPLPDAATIDSLLSFTGFNNVQIENGMLIKSDPRVQLDFNAIAQGYTVDLIGQFLEQKGIINYLVEVGGEVKTKGVNIRHKHWQIGIDKPVESASDQRELQTSVSLANQALATSGSYRKFKEVNGMKFSHVINPKTGYPANQTLLSVSVIADDCATADGYATAFLVMGLEKTMSFANEQKMPVFCIYADENGDFVVRASADFPNE